MTITTKYNIGDTVYRVDAHAQPEKLIIKIIEISISRWKTHITYKCTYPSLFFHDRLSFSVRQDDLFPSKQELLEHITKNF